LTILNRIHALWRWFAIDPRIFWLTLGVPTFALGMARLIPAPGELGARLAGFGVTLSGVYLVARGIRSRGQTFDRPGLRARLIGWLRRLPPIFLPAKIITASVKITGGVGSVSATGYPVTMAISGASLERRIEVLEANLRIANQRIDAAEQSIRQESSELRRLWADERTSREGDLHRLHSKLMELSVGDLDLELAGVAWVVFGTAMTTFPAELAHIGSFLAA
jgi:hypothetical protein